MIPIAKEVRLVMLLMGMSAAVAHYLFGFLWTWPAWLILVVFLFLFRDLKRTVPAIPLAIVSPVDGRVVNVRNTVHDPYLKRPAQSICLRQSVLGEFNVHSPIEGKVQNIWMHSSSQIAESELAVWMQTDERDDAVLAANLDSVLRHASCKISAGEKLGQGQRCGFMAFACEVVIYLPTTAQIGVNVGQLVRAGSDKLAEFIHDTDS